MHLDIHYVQNAGTYIFHNKFPCSLKSQKQEERFTRLVDSNRKAISTIHKDSTRKINIEK